MHCVGGHGVGLYVCVCGACGGLRRCMCVRLEGHGCGI